MAAVNILYSKMPQNTSFCTVFLTYLDGGGWADSTLGDFEPELRKQRQRGISFFFFFLERFLRLTVIGGIISCKLIMVFYLFQTTSSPLFNDVLFVNRKKSSPSGRRATVHCVCRLFIVAPLFAF